MAGSNPVSAFLIVIITIFFYLEYVYFERRSQGQMGNMAVKRAPGVYSDNVNSGGRTTYGTITA
ncbi:MAG: hypothetical protein L6R39_005620 [Caloplaca ligustica]|nr:MAG: hypothetical protein L6R39_005620 [Caloplaca ligustica]